MLLLSFCRRHSHLAHDSAKLLTLCDQPFRCNHRLPRVANSDGIPFGEYSYCLELFKSESALRRHKIETGHKVDRRGVQNEEAPTDPVVQEVAGNENGDAMDIDVEDNNTNNADEGVVADYEENSSDSEVEDDDDLGDVAGNRTIAQERGVVSASSRLNSTGPSHDAVQILSDARQELFDTGKVNRAKVIVSSVLTSNAYVRSYDKIKEWKRLLAQATTEAMVTSLIDDAIAEFERIEDSDDEDLED